LAAVAKLVIEAKELAFDSFGSGATLVVMLVREAPNEAIEVGATFALTTAAKPAAALVKIFAEAGSAPPLAAASLDKADALLTKDPVELIAIEAKKAPYAAAAGSVVVILEVGEVNGSGAESRLKPAGKPAATATVAFAWETAA